MVHNITMPPTQYWYCILFINIFFMLELCSTMFIISMTFDRFYSIIRPHKAASFNTVKRAKITIAFIVIFSILYNIPHFFIGTNAGMQCVPYGRGMQYILVQFYYWLSFVINFALPFVLLLTMNCFIIHKLRNRAKQPLRDEGQGQGEGHSHKIRSSETQLYVLLLLVTFAFLILTTPAYAFFLYVSIFDFTKSPYTFAGYHLFHHVGQKTHFTNHGINFFLYVISGSKFREDLVRLFKWKQEKRAESTKTSIQYVK